ncbi:putative membrane protein YgcG [Pseudomonas citronellolis]|uniref:virulence factor TspB C-terminal domain-related protein n=1 Tax=Pseudomonas citronellolis TaxID=53408 RepID=UPI00209FA8F5|nr:virulence factor TspB C-terminal domain-related protein [Pseudomonas citronellolis]MCP1643004.1 putative membrane protein YgcG [Pseudomonas citronellolis]MCP1665864.1 putative membrane protein YgcG [Pseudomonas citronellolis]MCP1696773.1 putative membrane protein YgcG [Pseudomonas citronellolis]MCP1703485.1 putative membrane protein YgcG [Pseudomonas citronellolis]MCP1797619.1 putative membrane protein YgcG [Pseudomonas citronellolis]
MFRLLILTICFLLSLPVWAETYYWNAVGKRFPDAMSACQAYAVEAWSFAGATVHSLALVSASLAECTVRHPNGTLSQTILYRGGDSCPPGFEYDESIGGCVALAKECESTIGELFPARGPLSPLIESGGRFYVAGPPSAEISACYQSCRYGGGSRASSCYRVSGSTTEGFCNYILKGLGESCSADSYQFATSGDPLNPGAEPNDPTVPPSDPNDPGCPSGWAWSGTTCVKDPSAGNGEGDGEDNGAGSGGGESNGGGGGGGSDEGDDGPSESSVGGEDCDAELNCSGDAIQCAVLRQQKELRCQIEVLNDFDKHQDDIAKTVEGEDFELTKDEEINVAGFLSEGTGRRFLPSACPADKTFSLRTGGGRTFAFTYAPLCQLATDLSYLIVIAATIFFAVYVGRSFGGE